MGALNALLLTGDLTDLPLDETAAVSETIYSDAVSWKKSFVFW